MTRSINELINDGGDCRTAPATPGLLKISLKKALSDGSSANLIPLFISNVAKVSAVKWSQILILTN